MELTNGIRPLSEREFRLFQTFIYKEAGIHLADVKMALVSGRLTRRLRALGLTDFTSYYERVLHDRDGERVQMFDAISTNETRFFREQRHSRAKRGVALVSLRERLGELVEKDVLCAQIRHGKGPT